MSARLISGNKGYAITRAGTNKQEAASVRRGRGTRGGDGDGTGCLANRRKRRGRVEKGGVEGKDITGRDAITEKKREE